PVRKRRRWVKVLLVVAAVLVLARLALGLALPSLADLAVRDLGWTARLQGSSLSLLGGSFELRGLELRPRSEPDAAEPFARVAIARVDADMSALLRGELRVHHATIDGVELTLVRDAEGRWQVPMPPASEPQAEEAEEPATPGEPALDFGLPVVVETVRLGGVRVAFRDDAVAPPVHGEISFDATVLDLGEAARPARLSADVAATGVLDAARVRGSFRTGARLLAGSVDVAVRGLRAAPVRGYLAALDLVPAAERVDADAVLEIDLQPR